MSRRRAAVLIVVHGLIAVHVAQWFATGLTVSPVEPSESMQTLRDNIVNAGFVFFALAIASTLILGRFFCGWGCHIVALQDLCSHVMTRLGVRPKAFRSRLLVYVPVGLAVYMFAWPVVHREIVRPIFADRWGRMPSWLGQSEPMPAMRTEFLVEDFWATFPSWPIAIPFLLLVGFATVYFLGSKGFCTYGCPYGGIFGPADLVAPGKIRVTDACHHCGHCTAVCTSNVRVHEEVRDFGAVVDPGCMKCMDCVSVCPNEALYFGLGKPTILTRPRDAQARERSGQAKASRRARYDLTKKEEWIFGLIFFGMFLAYRGMLNEVPMLMAVGMSGIGVFTVHKSWRCLVDPSVRLQNLQLKIKGRMRLGGRVTVVASVLAIVAACWSGLVRWNLWRGDELHARMHIPLSVVLSDGFAAGQSQREIAQRALEHYRIADSWVDRAGDERRGIGWKLTADRLVNEAYLHAVMGDLEACESRLMEVLRVGQPKDGLIFEIARVIAARERRAGREAKKETARALFEEALARHPNLDQIRAALSLGRVQEGRNDEAWAMWEDAFRADGFGRARPEALLQAAEIRTEMNQFDEAFSLVSRIVAEQEENAPMLLSAARWFGANKKEELALDAVEKALRVRTNRGDVQAQAAEVMATLGKPERALGLARGAIDRAKALGPHSRLASTLQTAGVVLLRLGAVEDGEQALGEAVEAVGYSPYDLATLGMEVARLAFSSQPANEKLLVLSVRAMNESVKGSPDDPMLRLSLARLFGGLGEIDAAMEQLRVAAELAKENGEIAALYAAALADAGRAEESKRWHEEAERRRANRGK